jgi:hypothetical protein
VKIGSSIATARRVYTARVNPCTERTRHPIQGGRAGPGRPHGLVHLDLNDPCDPSDPIHRFTARWP